MGDHRDDHDDGQPGEAAPAGEQAARWNQASGCAWVDLKGTLDGMFAGVRDVLVEAVDPAWTRVLDVGCGTGAVAVALAERLGDGAVVTGIDISEPMLEAARAGAERTGARAEFVVADAQRHRFEPSTYDAVVSRFGVMFFDDPVAAFANLRAATRPGGALRAVAWRGPDDNPFMTEAMRAAVGLVDLPPLVPDAPGQFGLADRARAERILGDGGWSGVRLEPLDVPCELPEPALRGYLTRLGHVSLALADRDVEERDRVIDAIRPAFDRYVDGDVVRFTAACWLVTATA